MFLETAAAKQILPDAEGCAIALKSVCVCIACSREKLSCCCPPWKAKLLQLPVREASKAAEVCMLSGWAGLLPGPPLPFNREPASCQVWVGQEDVGSSNWAAFVTWTAWERQRALFWYNQILYCLWFSFCSNSLSLLLSGSALLLMLSVSLNVCSLALFFLPPSSCTSRIDLAQNEQWMNLGP